jgi:hypothetical protein
MSTHQADHHAPPPDLQSVANRLDALASRERAAFRTDFAGRLALQAAEAARAEVALPGPRALSHTGERAVRHVIRRVRWNLALAAGVLLAITAGIVGVMLLSNPRSPAGSGPAMAGADSPTPPMSDEEFELADVLTATLAMLDSTGLAESVASLSQDADRVSSMLLWEFTDLSDLLDVGGGS